MAEATSIRLALAQVDATVGDIEGNRELIAERIERAASSEANLVVLPELASAYTDRSRTDPGVVHDGDAVVSAFAAIGWGWGGDWSSLKDYQHFSANDR